MQKIHAPHISLQRNTKEEGYAWYQGRSLTVRQKAALFDMTSFGNYCLFGGESVYKDGSVVDWIRTTCHGYNVNMNIALLYLPQEMTKPGTEVEVEVMGKCIKATVISILPDPVHLYISDTPGDQYSAFNCPRDSGYFI